MTRAFTVFLAVSHNVLQHLALRLSHQGNGAAEPASTGCAAHADAHSAFTVLGMVKLMTCRHTGTLINNNVTINNE